MMATPPSASSAAAHEAAPGRSPVRNLLMTAVNSGEVEAMQETFAVLVKVSAVT